MNGTVIARAEIHPEDYIPLARSIAFKIASSTPPSVDVEDLASEAMLAICQAAQRFDSTKANFLAYAGQRARGACLDFLRKQGRFSGENRRLRRIGRKLQDTQRVMEQEEGGIPALEQVAEQAGLDLDLARHAQDTLTSLCVLSSDAEINPFNDPKFRTEEGPPHPLSLNDISTDPDPLAIVEAQEAKDTIIHSLKALDMRQLAVFALYSYGAYTMSQIGTILDLSESRISQIQTDIRGILRKRIKREEQ